MIKKKLLNPGYKGLTILLISLILSFEYDHYINLSVFLFCIILLLFSDVKIKKIVLFFVPVILLALGVFFTGAIHGSGNVSDDLSTLNKSMVLISDLKNGLDLASRIMSYAGLGALFVLTTDPRHFIISLMQQFNFPRTFAYGILAAYSFIPIIRSEYHNMKCAYKARGALKRFFMLPLLVSAVRAADSIAIAMISKGFSAKSVRSQYLKFNVQKIDYLILILGVTVTLIVTIFF